ncbi:MAG: adenylosuccinate lyase [Candidatus Marinimicrobia bacterium]|jgi:adenylosuccinate lyase|nr:adenylosuccinate lyase [Candidatus Neomarinimicrobiota bacterium]MBT5956760.1 adenylosuccinate lyase [Candidatus Neomarinimicrobiota bacterium]MBT6870395.1 adenylosuccinate lyase [Candidatus Neomarinimicrobiota bacterium]MBT7377289.1 adenylosuccinate lyase [Candidatus Neomarinimicrobiota bacterium]|tara:strand:+ start:2278 stop:3573 length:1296 start_codon:yes stop_codon:yes gene_type:complete
MIERYTTPDMGRIWSDQNKYATWQKVEITVTEVLSDMGVVPKEVVKVINEKASFSVDRINEIEATTHHDVIAFLTNLAENIGPESRFIHMGMTSSDLLDTSLALLCQEAGEIILEKLKTFHQVLRKKASEHRETFQIGRSHGVHAEPITFGLKLAMWSEEIGRNIVRWERAVESIATGKISGAVGTYQHLDPEVETEACKRLGINAATVSSQVVQRDHHAEYLTTLAIMGASMEKIAVEIRHLQRTEVLEAEEFFSKGQKGSSAMPHKRNPIITERMTGFARLLRANAHAALENVALWHERDISHSSVERVIIPDSTNIMDYMLNKMIVLMENLLVYPDNMLKNLNKTGGLIFSQEVLLALIKKGITREESYAMVQRNAMQVWEHQKDFKTLLKADIEIMNLMSEDEIDDLFDLQKVMKNINKVFERLDLK